MNDFKDKVAVITGAASGIGRGIAEKLAQEGMKVVISDIEEPLLFQFEEDLKKIGADVLAAKVDVSKIEDVNTLAQKTIDHFGAVHLLVNNAGVGFGGKSSTIIWERPLAEWKWIFDVNLWGLIHGIHVFVPIMLKQDFESYVVNMCSMSGLISPVQGTSIYAITKHAIIALSEALKLELKRYGRNIKVLALCPGFVKTKLTESERNRPEELCDNKTTNPELVQIVEGFRQAIENGISPKEVAEALFQALNGERFYIPTDHHRFIRSNVKRRMEGIMKDLEK